jgi:hypothetical protein
MDTIELRLQKLLKDGQLWNGIANAFDRHRDDQWDDFDFVGRVSDDREMAHDITNTLRPLFEMHVIDKLPRPVPITSFDLSWLAIDHLAGLPIEQLFINGECGDAAKRFEAFALTHVRELQFGHAVLDFAAWNDSTDDEPQNPFGKVLWRSESGFELHASIEKMIDCRVTGTLEAACTPQAMTEAEDELKLLVGSIAKTTQLSVMSSEKTTSDDFLEIKNPPLPFLFVGDGKRVLDMSMSAYYRALGDEEDALIQRLHNATTLLVQADKIASDPLALSVSFAAIEALICEEHELPVNTQIKRHVPTLLVQDAESSEATEEENDNRKKRRKAKEKVMNKLYDIRCDVMHGTNVHASRDASEAVRRIAAGVVRAVTCWRKNQEGAGGDTTWKELLDELNAASRKGAIVVGVPDLSEVILNKAPN